MIRQDEDAIRIAWQASINAWDRPSDGSKPVKKKPQALSRRMKQLQYAAECYPKMDGDAEIIRLYGEGMPVAEIAREIGRDYDDTRERLWACHPQRRGLK